MMIRRHITREKIWRAIRLLPAATFLVSDFNTGGNSLFAGIANGASIADLVNALFKLAIILGAMLAVLRLVYAGFLYMASDIWSKKDEAKTAIQNALIGLMLLLATYLILNQINPNILNLNVSNQIQQNPPGTAASPQTTSTGASDVQFTGQAGSGGSTDSLGGLLTP